MKKSEVVNAVAVIMAGMMSNPAAVRMIDPNYNWERQQLFHSLLNDIGSALASYGIMIDVEEVKQ